MKILHSMKAVPRPEVQPNLHGVLQFSLTTGLVLRCLNHNAPPYIHVATTLSVHDLLLYKPRSHLGRKSSERYGIYIITNRVFTILFSVVLLTFSLGAVLGLSHSSARSSNVSACSAHCSYVSFLPHTLILTSGFIAVDARAFACV